MIIQTILFSILILLVSSLSLIKDKKPSNTQEQPLTKAEKWSCIRQGMERANILTMNDEINQRVLRATYFDNEDCINAVYQYYLTWRFGK